MEENAPYAMRERLQGGGNSRANIEDETTISPRLGFAKCASPAFPREYRKHQPVLGRGIHGIPNRVDRIGSLGNAVVPQIPELIGNAILEVA
jgi:DNA (cytosine-5)-methyltransferase 1